MRFVRARMASSALAMSIVYASTTCAAPPPSPSTRYDIPSEPMSAALLDAGRISGKQILFPGEQMTGRMSPALHGDLPVEQALAKLLQGTPFTIESTPDAIFIRGRSEAASASTGDAASASQIIVTGTRITGAAVASSKITVTAADIERGGFTDLGQALRAVPQNFSGGQNPGVSTGAVAGGIANQNITGGSSVNLRGLGPDATLTLFNGNRLAYGGFSQGVDVSAIPVDALARVDIVPDGASAIYGSDAVAGVVNVVLRQDLDGGILGSTIGGATEGGDFSQSYSAVAGAHWDGGRVLATYNYRQNSAIQAGQRSYTAYLDAPFQLLPESRDHSAIIEVAQRVLPGVEFSDDTLFNRRMFSSAQSAYGELLTTRTADWGITTAPSLRITAGAGWTFHFNGVYSDEHTKPKEDDFYQGISVFSSSTCYCNRLYSGEAFVEGAPVHLPAGSARIVIGGGFRTTRLADRDLLTAETVEGGNQKDGFGYAELFVPIIAPSQQIGLVHALSVTAAGRYDHYNRFGGVGTPKLGVIYSPLNGLDLKFSWGQSFKAPTLLQQFQTRSASLIPANSLVGSTASEDATALYTEGGSANLKPERATTSSWTIEYHSPARKHLDASLTYFRVSYRDRVLEPIGRYVNALNPSYSDYVVVDPSAAQAAAAIAASSTGLQNFAGMPYDPADVAYLIDNHYTNIARQKIQGIDLSISDREPVGRGALVLTFDGSWLDSRQKNGSTSTDFDLSGTVWNPPRFRYRAGVGWDGPRLEAFAFLNYLSGISDTRFDPPHGGASMATVDLSVNYTFAGQGSALNGTKIGLSIQNLLDEKPPYLTPAAYSEPYDSTNYSAVGRFISFSISKKI